MESRRRLLIGFGIALMVVINMTGLACFWFFAVTQEPPRDVEIAATESEYRFDPYTILPSVEQGQSNLFALVWQRDMRHDTRPPETSDTPTPMPGRSPLAWGESDFEKVVQAFARALQKERIQNANLYEIHSFTACPYAQIGPQEMNFSFFKIITVDGKKHYSLNDVNIDLETARLQLLESELIEVNLERQALDRRTHYVPAEAALRSAEQAGGSGFRAQANDQCRIHARVIEGIRDSEWEVDYEQTVAPWRKFEVQIDKRTGQGKVLNPPRP